MNNKATKMLVPILMILLLGAFVGYGVLTVLNTQTVEVVMPARDIKAGETLSTENLKRDFISKNAVHPDAIRDIKMVLGKVALTPLYANEQILSTRVNTNQSVGYLKQMQNAEQNFAVQIPVEENAAPSGLKTGDKVALIATMQQNNNVTGVLGQDFMVINVNSNENGVITGITVEVTPDKLAAVTQALTLGKVKIALVDTKHAVTPVNGITGDEFAEMLKQPK